MEIRRRSCGAAAVACAAMLAGCEGPPTPVPAPPPPATAAPGFVVLSDVDPTILTDIRYATGHNFVGRPIAGYREPLCLITRQAADALHRVQAAALARGFSLKVYDCYRPQQAVDDFVRWARSPDEQQMKAEFYPRVDKSRLFVEGYIGTPTAHSRGSAVDLTLVPALAPARRPYRPGEPLMSCIAPPDRRFPDDSVDMGTDFDCFDPLAHTDNPGVSPAARKHRNLLRQLMADGGFVNYPKEWWHYRLTEEPYPDTYYDFPVARSSLPPA